MSALGKAIRTHLVAQTGYSATIPGGISPEIAPAGVTMPFVVYTGSEDAPVLKLDGTTICRQASVNFVVTAMTRSDCESVVAWLRTKLEQGTWVGTANPKVFFWRITSHSDVSEVILDGSDESVRLVNLQVDGAYI